MIEQHRQRIRPKATVIVDHAPKPRGKVQGSPARKLKPLVVKGSQFVLGQGLTKKR